MLDIYGGLVYIADGLAYRVPYSCNGREVSARFVFLYVFATGVILTFEGRFLWFFVFGIQTMA